MTTIMFSFKGQVVITKHNREAKGFAPDIESKVIDHRADVLVKSVSPTMKRSLLELMGMLAPYCNAVYNWPRRVSEGEECSC